MGLDQTSSTINLEKVDLPFNNFLVTKDLRNSPFSFLNFELHFFQLSREASTAGFDTGARVPEDKATPCLVRRVKKRPGKMALMDGRKNKFRRGWSSLSWCVVVFALLLFCSCGLATCH